ncbi:hypothetical protein M3O75_16180 [Klebsiella pneumoniae]|nr:hypothetical protein [Klebsiella pneumoniae]
MVSIAILAMLSTPGWECPALSETRRVGYWKTVTFTDSIFMLGPYHGQIRSTQADRQSGFTLLKIRFNI